MVAAAFYPLAEIVSRVGGSSVHVLTLVPPGQEAHLYEPTAQQAAALERAKLVIYIGDGFQPVVQRFVHQLPSSVQRLDVLSVLHLLPATRALPGTSGGRTAETLGGGGDPHVWLDPGNMRAMAAAVAEALVAIGTDPALVRRNLASYDASLAALASDLRLGLAHCATTYIVTGHQAFAYLAHATGLTQVAVAGISPEDEPSAATLASIVAFLRLHHVTTVFSERNLSPAIARTLASEAGAGTAQLDTLETLSHSQLAAGEDYVSLMRANLATLRSGLGCT
jgi:zinc transport system substrate-binding protein